MKIKLSLLVSLLALTAASLACQTLTQGPAPISTATAAAPVSNVFMATDAGGLNQQSSHEDGFA